MDNIKLSNFSKISINIDIDELAKKHADKLSSKINNSINSYGWKGEYKDSWSTTKKADGSYIVSSTQYQLTHLLEKGHLIVNKIGGIGFAAPHPHIFNNARKEIEDYKKEAEKLDIELEIK